MTRSDSEPAQRTIDTLRFLSVDAVEKATSGHPGLPLGAAPMAYAVWANHLRHDPSDPRWANRDRFVLSAGHGSALLYSLLHLFGYDLPLSELRSFRQWGSRTPGHPESHVTEGVEVTTGPLGQGLANAVGLAIAERHLAATFNRPGHDIVDHRTYVLASDGDLMEGVGYEACSLAGHLRLGRLHVLFDNNRSSLAGATSLCQSEDIGARFEAAGWHVLHVEDGNDVGALDRALSEAAARDDRPSLIVVRTIIGYGAPTVQDSFQAHGKPLGEGELAATKQALGWPSGDTFLIPSDVRQHVADVAAEGQRQRRAWEERYQAYRLAEPELAAEFERRLADRRRDGWDRDLPGFDPDPDGMPTRKASEKVLQALATGVPELIGGSGDLNPSTYTWLKGHGDFQAPGAGDPTAEGAVGDRWGYDGRNLHFGVREHAMGAIVNGMTQHGGLIAYGASFLVFSDYMRPPIRLAALSGYGSVFVYTHDSIGLGEDGPTHQPVEQLMSLRLIPDLVVLRPADAKETVGAWRQAIERRDGPTVLVLTRQAVPTLAQTDPDGVARGAYMLWESDPDPEVILIATGSELAVAARAAETVAQQGGRVRVVSMPSFELFERQPVAYRQEILPDTVTARVAVEAGREMGWERYVGSRGRAVGIDRYGASAPGKTVMEKLGFTVAGVIDAVNDVLRRP